MTDEQKRIVAAGYDAITANYLRLVESSGQGIRDKYLAIIAREVTAGARLLELGCGAGEPMTRRLSAPYEVTGLDISARQLSLARANAPGARLVRGDMVRLPFQGDLFDCVAAFYSTTHVPRAEHRALLAEVRRVLCPGGLAVLTMGYNDNPDGIDPDWMGAPMFFSHYGGDANVSLVREAGFEVLQADDETAPEHGRPVTFRWVVARRAG